MHTLIRIISLATILTLLPSQSTQSPQQQCTAGVLFLRSSTSQNPLLTPPPTESLRNSTYTIQISYPCDTSPLQKIEKLRDRVKDPFVSFYLKKHKSKRQKRLTEYEGSGGGDYDDDNEDDDDEEEDEEEEDEEEYSHTTIEPSNHVIVLLPTPSIQEPDNSISIDPPPSSRYQPPELTSTILESIVPTRSWGPPTHSYFKPATDEDNLLFPNLGSGDGPLVMTTPIYNPTENTISSSSSPPYYSSSFTPTPVLTSHLLHPIRKQLIYSGTQHKLIIPPNTFQPPCHDYQLQEPDNWVDVKRNVVQFFPVTQHISDYTFHVECTDHSGIADMYVSVRQRQKSRLHNHVFELEFGMIRQNLTRVEILGKLVQEVRSILGSHGNGTDLVVLNTELDTYPFRVSYVNETIISNVCPVEELKLIYDKLQGSRVHGNGLIKMENVKISIPDNNQCDSNVVAIVTGEKVTGGYGENYPPTIKNQIDRLNGSCGEYFVYGVREDFCYDPEDGGTRGLRIELKSSELSNVGEEYWLQFDGKNQEFYGLPMEVEERGLVLVCYDRGGKSANDVIELQITPARVPPTTYNTEFSLHFQSVPFTPKAIRKFIEKLSQILDNQIQVHTYSESNNHVLFKWFNTSNPSNEHEVTEIRKVLLSDDGPVNKRLYEHFSPEFNVTVASVVPLRGLLSENNPVDDGGKEDNSGRYFDFESGDGDKSGGGFSGDGKNIEGVVNVDNYSGYLTTYIIPSVLIAVMILLALIIACLLSRKNKYTQANTEDDSPNARVYLKNAKKGVPVIFQDELDDKKLFGNGQGEHRGNIYEPPTPRSASGTPHTHHAPPPLNRTDSPGMQSPRVISPQPTHPSRNQPPDYQNSISRSMMRNRAMGIGSPPPGGVPVFPNKHSVYDRTPQHHQGQIDSYMPPPGISYYGIHNSNSGGSGFSGISSGGYPVQHHQQQHHHHHGGNSNKMAPPPYVPP